MNKTNSNKEKTLPKKKLFEKVRMRKRRHGKIYYAVIRERTFVH